MSEANRDEGTNRETVSQPTKDAKTPLTELSRQTFELLFVGIIESVQKGFTKEFVWMVIARILFNKKEFCQEIDCKETRIHFHESWDWTDPKIIDVLKNYWQGKDIRTPKTEAYIAETFQYVTSQKAYIMEQFQKQAAESKQFLDAVLDEVAREFIESLTKDDIQSFPFQCAIVCAILDMQEPGTDDHWFESVFKYFVDDDESDSEDESGNEEDDDDESGNDDEENESEDGETDSEPRK